MIVDSHTHLFSKDFESYPRQSEPPEVRRVVASAEQLKAEMDAAGVDRAVTISPWIYLWDNSYAMDCLAGFSEWLATVVLVDPKAPDGPEKLRRLVSEGASGLRIHGRPFNDIACDDPVTTPLWRAAAELDLAVDLCVTQDQYTEVETRLKEFSSLRVILDHCGYLSPDLRPRGPAIDPAIALAKYPNVYAKVTFLDVAAAGHWPYSNHHWMVRQIVQAFGPERCMWGSNFPTWIYSPGGTYLQNIDVFRNRIGLSESECRWVLGETAATLWRWGDS